jgi:hypothetical protein
VVVFCGETTDTTNEASGFDQRSSASKEVVNAFVFIYADQVSWTLNQIVIIIIIIIIIILFLLF